MEFTSMTLQKQMVKPLFLVSLEFTSD